MKTVYIYGGLVAKVSDEDFDFVSRFTWFLARGYATRCIGYKKLSMHQMLVECQSGMYIDHIDGDRLNNTRENLRIVTPKQNQRNTRPKMGKRYKGIILTPNGCWQAKIAFNQNPIHLGTFKTEEAAARAYDRKAHELDPEFSRLNFSDGIWTEEKLEEFRIKAAWPASGLRGIQANGSGWSARVKRSGKNLYIGTFTSKEEAMTERNKFLAKLAEEHP